MLETLKSVLNMSRGEAQRAASAALETMPEGVAVADLIAAAFPLQARATPAQLAHASIRNGMDAAAIERALIASGMT